MRKIENRRGALGRVVLGQNPSKSGTKKIAHDVRTERQDELVVASACSVVVDGGEEYARRETWCKLRRYQRGGNCQRMAKFMPRNKDKGEDGDSPVHDKDKRVRWLE